MRSTHAVLTGVAALAVAAPGASLAVAQDAPTSTTELGVGDVAQPLIKAARDTHGAAQRRVTRAARRVAHRKGEARIPRKYTKQHLAPRSIPALERRELHLRRQLRRLKRAEASTASPQLEAIAACESGGDPSTDTGNGFYGKYQFTMSTWAAVGGSGNPAQAPEAEQDRRAAQLLSTAGSGQWPVCGR